MNSVPSIEKLRVKPGDRVSAGRWNALLDWARALLDTLSQMAGPGLRVDRAGDGISLWSEPGAASFTGAFWCSLVGDNRATIGPGSVDGIVPRVAGKLIFDAEKPADVPRLRLEPPSEGARSFIALIARAAKDQPLDPDDETALVIESRASLRAVGEEKIRPLAEVRWQKKKAVDIRQIEFFDLRFADL